LLLLLALVSKFLRDYLLYLLGVNAIALRSMEQVIVRISAEPLVCGIEQADLQQ